MTIQNRYQFIEKIVGGGMSNTAIYLDENLNRKVLIKSISNSIDQPRLLDEIKALQTIRSRHVVQIFDVVIDSSGTITNIVEEYIKGRHLSRDDFIKNGSINLYSIYQIAKGISDIHQVAKYIAT